MEFRKILEMMMEHGASDLHLKAGSRPILRVDGELRPIDWPPCNQKDLELVAEKILSEEQQAEFKRTMEVDFGFGIAGLARFRSNFYYQRGSIAMAIRHVPLGVPAFEDLHLPEVLGNLAMKPRGLLLVTGTVGSGKSTTLASMIDLINRTTAKNIITIEDPIEFLHRDEKSLISQREVGLDTESYLIALKHILRQDPDVILLGEIRDRQTMDVALMAADTGHFVMSTLHTADATQTINRIVSFYPAHQHDEVRFLLAGNLAAVVSMRLIGHKKGTGRVPAVEVMINTETIRDYIQDPLKTVMINQAISEGVSQYGMQSFDQSLMGLLRNNLITLDDAIANATNPVEFDLRIKGIQATSDKTWDSFEGDSATEDGAEDHSAELDASDTDINKLNTEKPWERFG